VRISAITVYKIVHLKYFNFYKQKTEKSGLFNLNIR